MEKRKFTRVAFNTEAIVTSASGSTARGEVENLSLNGLFLRTKDKLPDKEDLKIRIELTGDSSELAINMNGHALRHEQEGIALQFNMTTVELDSLTHLRYIVSYNSDEDTFIREYGQILDSRPPQDPKDE